ncbi:hypothetical protein BT63DRAFT_429548 [Microthyrium microscopicum]|uniref:Zn(2)-C6 fungal-type domain-containing protein n=1 Tax=Microthyrium microscopicum TaxID=703497 RepID=A0A6A6TYE1_9PEZI|nr:hypothetical protein BT63DRAFT_429548 [Microthyrium microscopicum]
MHANECWACGDSRAICNRERPRCSRCAKLNKPCRYGLRLSWPKKTSTKRSLTYPVQDVFNKAKTRHQISFLNATTWDIQLHEYLRMNQGLGSHERSILNRNDPPIALSWLPNKLGYEERELLDHFICTATSTLAVFERDKNEFLSLLMRLFLFDDSPSSAAVLQSALALSSFHRNGLRADVFRFRERALHTLVTSCDDSTESLVQHVAARMILCHLEMNEMSDDVWFCHVVGAKKLIDSVGVENQIFQGELSRLIAWAEYHMVMSRFSLRHWYINKQAVQRIQKVSPIQQETCLLTKIKDVSSHSHDILRHLYIMFEMIQDATNSSYHSDEYENFLSCFENSLSIIDTRAPASTSDSVSNSKIEWAATIELFKLSGLIYLKRASRNFSGHSLELDTMVQRAYVLLDNLRIFSSGWPLLIIGCEARTDEHRMMVLERIERAQTSSNSRSLLELRSILEQIWVQDDLATGYELSYLNKLDAVIGSYSVIPSFV